MGQGRRLGLQIILCLSGPDHGCQVPLLLAERAIANNFCLMAPGDVSIKYRSSLALFGVIPVVELSPSDHTWVAQSRAWAFCLTPHKSCASVAGQYSPCLA